MDPYEYPAEPLRSEAEIAKDVETIRSAVKGFGTDEKASLHSDQDQIDSLLELISIKLYCLHSNVIRRP